MKFVIGIAVAAALSFTSTTFAESTSANTETRQVVALADTSAASTDLLLEAYVGRYVANDGDEFAIVLEDDGLTIEAPESWGLPTMTLRAQGRGSFVTIDGAVRVSFRIDGTGQVSGASISSSVDGPTLATDRVRQRGIVTIHDLSDEAAIARVIRHGIVTIYDVPDEVASSAVAAAN